MLRKNTVNDRLKRNDSSSMVGNSTNISALDRLRYNLSPVKSYYKPLIKSFSRRDDSPSKVSSSIFDTYIYIYLQYIYFYILFANQSTSVD